jgi:hypothetical protein
MLLSTEVVPLTTPSVVANLLNLLMNVAWDRHAEACQLCGFMCMHLRFEARHARMMSPGVVKLIRMPVDGPALMLGKGLP